MSSIKSSEPKEAPAHTEDSVIDFSSGDDDTDESPLGLGSLSIQIDGKLAEKDDLSPGDSISMRCASRGIMEDDDTSNCCSMDVLDPLRMAISTSNTGSEDSYPSNQAVTGCCDDDDSESSPGSQVEEACYKAKADWHAENLRNMGKLNRWHSDKLERYDRLARDRANQPARDPELFRNRYLEIKSSPLSGLGIFALQDLHMGTEILREKAILVTSERTIYSDLEKLRPDILQAFYRLHAHYNDRNIDRSTAILRTNGFIASQDLAIFLVASRFNNACYPRNNVSFTYDSMSECISLEAREDVAAGTELTVCYGGQPRVLLSKWGFRCSCGGCSPLTDAECEEITSFSENW